MKTLSEIKDHARGVRVHNRVEWLDGVKKVAGETMLSSPFKDICIKFYPETLWGSGTVLNGSLLICGEWRKLFDDDYAELAKRLIENDPFFEGWRVDIGIYNGMKYLVVTEIDRSKNG